MKLTKKQVRDYLEAWMGNFSSEGDVPEEVVGQAFASDNALIDWGYKTERFDEYPEYDWAFALKVVREY